LLVDQAQVRFVHKRSRLQRVSGAFIAQHTGGNAPQLVVNERNELIECSGITTAPLFEESRDTHVPRRHKARFYTSERGGSRSRFKRMLVGSLGSAFSEVSA